MEPGAHRDDVPGPAAGRGTDTPGSVFEGSAMAPMRREPSLGRRKPRAAATGPPPARFSLLDVKVVSCFRWVWGLLAGGLQRERLMLAKYSFRARENSK
jgi:hypothetical protein